MENKQIRTGGGFSSHDRPAQGKHDGKHGEGRIERPEKPKEEEKGPKDGESEKD